MAKRPKKSSALRQQRIPGSIDAPTDAVLRKAESYVEVLGERMKLQGDENALRAELIDMMKEADLVTFTLNGHMVTLTCSETEKIVIKKDQPEKED